MHRMRLLFALLWLAGAGGGIAVAEEVPLPRPRPAIWIEPQSFREAAGPDFDSAGVIVSACSRHCVTLMMSSVQIPRTVSQSAMSER